MIADSGRCQASHDRREADNEGANVHNPFTFKPHLLVSTRRPDNAEPELYRLRAPMIAPQAYILCAGIETSQP
jgi:hypothetical protein